MIISTLGNERIHSRTQTQHITVSLFGVSMTTTSPPGFGLSVLVSPDGDVLQSSKQVVEGAERKMNHINHHVYLFYLHKKPSVGIK